MSNTIFNDSNAKIKVKIGSSGGISGSTPGANAITVTSSSSGQGKLTDLLDVEDSVEVDGGTLVYDSATDTYTLQALNVDGGTF